jgi:RNA recognition motif-containing protein
MNRRNNPKNNPISNPRRNGRRTHSQTLRRRNISSRRNRRFGQALNRRRTRLARAQFASRNNQNRRRRFVFRPRTRMNLRLRKLFIGGLHKSINNRKLYNLFRQEGRILGWKVFYDNYGNSRGFGVLEFDRPRDAWKTIQKWNNTPYMGYNLRIEYKNNLRRRMNRNRRNFNTNNKGKFRNNVNNRGFNYGKNNNYQNTVRNVNNNVNRNRRRYYYYY